MQAHALFWRFWRPLSSSCECVRPLYTVHSHPARREGALLVEMQPYYRGFSGERLGQT